MSWTVEEELGGSRAVRILDAIATKILTAREILITTHVHPDGDAIGSELALALALERLGRRAVVVNDHPAPEKYGFLDGRRTIRVIAGEAAVRDFSGADLGILLDASEPGRTGRLEQVFFRKGLERICIDHHPGAPSGLFVHHWVAPASPSTGNLVLRLLDALGVPMDREIAKALFVAMATDTGWFRFSNTTPLALRDAARILGTGLDLAEIHRRIYEESSPERLNLLGRLLAGIRTDFGGRFAWALLDRETLARSGVAHEELDGFSEQLKGIRGAEVVALVVETGPCEFKVSLRSLGDLPVNGIAAAFSGGGHVKAAGCRLQGNREDVVAALSARVRLELEGPRARG